MSPYPADRTSFAGLGQLYPSSAAALPAKPWRSLPAGVAADALPTVRHDLGGVQHPAAVDPCSRHGGPSSDGPDGQPRRRASSGDGPEPGFTASPRPVGTTTRADSPLSSRSGGRDAETRNAPAEQRLDLLLEQSRGQLNAEAER